MERYERGERKEKGVGVVFFFFSIQMIDGGRIWNE